VPRNLRKTRTPLLARPRAQQNLTFFLDITKPKHQNKQRKEQRKGVALMVRMGGGWKLIKPCTDPLGLSVSRTSLPALDLYLRYTV
jgi:hypothetical protein